MVKINNDYPLNPCCSKPSIAGKRMSRKWYVYFYYNLNGKRLQFKEYTGLNNKSDSLAQRKQRAVVMCDLLHQKLQQRTFNIITGSFENTAAEEDAVSELITEYLVIVRLKLTKETYRNYTTLLTQFRNFVSGQTLPGNQTTTHLKARSITSIWANLITWVGNVNSQAPTKWAGLTIHLKSKSFRVFLMYFISGTCSISWRA